MAKISAPFAPQPKRHGKLMARIVFDLDGTLIDSAPDIRAAVNLMLVEQGLLRLCMRQDIALRFAPTNPKRLRGHVWHRWGLRRCLTK